MKPFLQYMYNSNPIIFIYKHSDKDYSFSFSTSSGDYQEFNFTTPMKCLTAAESAYGKFNGMPKQGGWK